MAKSNQIHEDFIAVDELMANQCGFVRLSSFIEKEDLLTDDLSSDRSLCTL
jgi:hypothetical protein